MEKRLFEIKVEVNGDGSEFKFVASCNGEKIRESEIEYCFEDLMGDYSNFSSNVFEDYKIDCRFDSVKVNLSYNY